MAETLLLFAVKVIAVLLQLLLFDNNNSAPPVIEAVGKGFTVTEIIPLEILVQPNPFVTMTL